MKLTQKINLKLKIISLQFLYKILSEVALGIRNSKLIQLKIAIGLFLLSGKSLYSQEKITIENNPNQVDSLNLNFEMERTAQTLCYESGYPDSFFKEPEIKGGQKTYNKIVFNNLRYPQEAIDNSIEGYVSIRITVDENGETSNPTIVKGLGYGCDEEAMRLLKMIPKFKPGIMKGKKATMDKIISFQFILPRE